MYTKPAGQKIEVSKICLVLCCSCDKCSLQIFRSISNVHDHSEDCKNNVSLLLIDAINNSEE